MSSSNEDPELAGGGTAENRAAEADGQAGLAGSFEDYLPLTAVRTAPGEYDIKTRDGQRLWFMEGASLADWICQSVNGYSAAVKSMAPLAHPDGALLDACRQFVHWYSEDSTELNRDNAYEAAVAAIKRSEGILEGDDVVNETYGEQLDRVKLMAGDDPTWDLSENDTAALGAVLDRLAECECLLVDVANASKNTDGYVGQDGQLLKRIHALLPSTQV